MKSYDTGEDSDSKYMTTATAVWIATASLQMRDENRDSFHIKEIMSEIRSNRLVNTSPRTVISHITVHCVANIKPWPNTHRKLYKISPGWYRLYKDGDNYHPDRRNGQSVPPDNEIPKEYKNVVKWYQTKYNINKKSKRLESMQQQFAPIENNGYVKLPDSIIDRLSLQENGLVAFIENTSGDIVLKKARIEVE